MVTPSDSGLALIIAYGPPIVFGCLALYLLLPSSSVSKTRMHMFSEVLMSLSLLGLIIGVILYKRETGSWPVLSGDGDNNLKMAHSVAPPEPQKSRVFIASRRATYPDRSPDSGELITLDISTMFVETFNGTPRGAVSTLTIPPGKLLTDLRVRDKKAPTYLIELTNDSDTPIYNLAISFEVELRDAVKADNGRVESGNTFHKEIFTQTIPRIDPGLERKYILFVRNESGKFVYMQPRSTASAVANDGNAEAVTLIVSAAQGGAPFVWMSPNPYIDETKK